MRSPLLLGATLVLLGCPPPEPEPEPEPIDTTPEFLTVEIPFEARVANDPFTCNGVFQGVGTSSAAIEFQDFRMYIHGVGLLDADAAGELTPVELDEDFFQSDGTVLLDFETGDFECEENGTPETHTTVTGRVPYGEYVGIAFTTGVPFDKNHPRTLENAVAPLDDPYLFQSPLFGYYFIRLDLTSVGERDGYPIYVHSWGCQLDQQGTNVTRCLSPNTSTFTLEGFELGTHKVVLDLRELLARNDVNRNFVTPPPRPVETPAGCQSNPSDEDCRDLFTSYGLSALPPTWVRYEE